ncbi:hypothetical protein F1600_11085 [Yersinia pestis]|nr:hypothetical protein [Yersinia pestis]KAA5814003.1 hypothetical protein F1600_11085 [Yersinia pestis]
MSQVTHYSIILRLWNDDHWRQRIGTASSLSISARDSTSSTGLPSQFTINLNRFAFYCLPGALLIFEQQCYALLSIFLWSVNH